MLAVRRGEPAEGVDIPIGPAQASPRGVEGRMRDAEDRTTPDISVATISTPSASDSQVSTPEIVRDPRRASAATSVSSPPLPPSDPAPWGW